MNWVKEGQFVYSILSPLIRQSFKRSCFTMRTRTKILITAAMLGVVGVLIAVATSALFSASTTPSGVNVAATGALSITGGDGVYFDNSAPGLVKLRPVADINQARADNSIIGGTTTVTNPSTTTTLTVRMIQQQVGGSGLAPGDGKVAGGTKDALFNYLKMCVSDNPATDCVDYGNNFDVAPVSTDLGAGDAVDSSTITTFTLLPGASKTLRVEVWMQDVANVTDNAYTNQKATAIFRFDAS